ncbi:MAG TPA: ester cyclase, partial [Micromonosporaceae bacterium]|nr:ester cyclase [Micromonosporaceae bacterium]
DLRYKIVDVVAGGERVAVHWRAAGTQLGQFGPVPPTGRLVSYSGATFLRFDPTGKIVDVWSVNELFQVLQQLGVEMLPPATGGAESAGQSTG